MNALMQRSGSASDTHAPATFTQLPLGGASSAPPMPTVTAEGENLPSRSGAVGHQDIPDHPQYLRLFGLTRPDQVMVSVTSAHSSPGGDGTCGSLGAFCDPKDPASHPLFELLAVEGHPSAAAFASIAQLRERHIAKGLTTATDADRGPAWWWHGVHEFWWKAHDAGDDRIARRKALVSAAALIVARIDVEDFLARQQEAASHE